MLAFQIPFLINFSWSLARGRKAEKNPWKSNTLDWTTGESNVTNPDFER